MKLSLKKLMMTITLTVIGFAALDLQGYGGHCCHRHHGYGRGWGGRGYHGYGRSGYGYGYGYGRGYEGHGHWGEYGLGLGYGLWGWPYYGGYHDPYDRDYPYYSYSYSPLFDGFYSYY